MSLALTQRLTARFYLHFICLYVYVYVHLCLLMHLCAGTHKCSCTWRPEVDIRYLSWSFSTSWTPHWTWSSQINQADLPLSPTSLLAHCWNERYTSQHPAFYIGTMDRTPSSNVGSEHFTCWIISSTLLSLILFSQYHVIASNSHFHSKNDKFGGGSLTLTFHTLLWLWH